MGGIYEVNKNSGGAITGTKTYYPAAGAMRDGSTLYYVLKDHLGSASVLTNASGGTVAGADTRYYPFGEARFSTSAMITDKLFTGQRQIAELGIYHYGARFYSPKLGRFLSADTVTPDLADPQSLNRFSYVLNNPLRYTDPTGHRACEDGDGQGSCLSEKQATKKYKAELHKNKHKKKSDGGGGPNNDELVEKLNEFAIQTQDMATFIDATFAYLEFGLAAGGCLATIEAGCFEGGLAGLALGQATFNLSGANALETMFSFASLAFTVAADKLDDGELGEATTTSAVTFGVGTMMIDPIADFMVDGYASGYNHGVFNGIGTIFNGGPFLQEWVQEYIWW